MDCHELQTKSIFESQEIPIDTSFYHDEGFEYSKQLYINLFRKNMNSEKYRNKVIERLENNFSLYKITINEVENKMNSINDVESLISFCKIIKLIDMKGSYKVYNC